VKFPYHRNFEPPASALAIEVFAPDDPDRREQVLAQLDTGADISAMPLRLVTVWQMEPLSEIIVSGFDAVPKAVRTYTVGIELPDVHVRRSEVILIAGDHALIGRDILNRFHVNLDGPELIFEMRGAGNSHS
jgi:hypothetical protein